MTSHHDSETQSTTAWSSVAALAGVLGLRMLGLFMVLPVLALYAEGLPGATPLLVGLSLGIYGLTQAVLQIPVGRLSDRVGRKPVILAGLLVFIIGSVVAALADSAPWLVLGRALQGAGAISAAVTALVGDLTAVARRTRAMALIGISIGMAFMLAFIAGPVLSSWVGVNGLFWITVGLGAVAILLVLWVVPPATSNVSRNDPEARSIWRILPEVRIDVLMVMTVHALLMAVFLVLPRLIVERLGLPPAEHGWVYLPVMLGSILVMGPLILLEERRPKTLALPLAVFLLGAGFAAWTWFDQTSAVYIGLLLFFGGFNFIEAQLPARVSVKSRSEERGGAMGWYATGQFFGAFIGGAMGGILLGHGGNSAILHAGFGVVALWWLLLLGATIRTGMTR